MKEQQVADVGDAPIKTGTRVLVRVDYNVPMTTDGKISDDKRMVDSLPTIRYLLERGAKVILCSHFGRPEGKPEPQYSLRPVYQHLQALLPNVTVQFAEQTVGTAVEQQVATMPNGSVLLLENTRFQPEETANDAGFAQQLARLGEIFVNDAFGAAHRAHASTVGVADYLPSYAGLLMAREIAQLSQVTAQPKRPFTVIIGGKKVADKMPLARKLAERADYLLVGGKIAADWQDDGVKRRAKIFIAPDQGLDISMDTVATWRPIIESSKTIFWNGPLGQFDVDPANGNGTRAVATIVSNSRAVSVVGGGDTAAAVKGFKFTHVSTGGGAALEFVEGTTLPGIACLKKKGEK
ncbi:MAG: phosphoglycerate kinase [Eubacteriales bacterium]|nr:phosphoglycerate kinase [Eubacteriales bacterium]